MSDLKELVITREIAASSMALFRCWTEPDLIKQWFTPPPWKVSSAQTDLRPGGSTVIVMQGPNGEEFPNRGVYLEVDPGRKIVFTDAYVDAWTPSEKPFMTGVLTFEDIGGGRTRYTARVRHWTDADLQTHRQMGFEQGWGIATDQLAALAATL